MVTANACRSSSCESYPNGRNLALRRRSSVGIECLQELELGICSLAAPIQLGEAGVSMSVGATGSTRVFSCEFRDRIGPALIALAGELASQLDAPVE